MGAKQVQLCQLGEYYKYIPYYLTTALRELYYLTTALRELSPQLKRERSGTVVGIKVEEYEAQNILWARLPECYLNLSAPAYP